MLLHRLTADPDLGALPPGDRPVVARALARDAETRFPSCLDFIQALETVRREAETLLKRKDVSPEVKAGLERILAQTRGEFDLGGDIE